MKITIQNKTFQEKLVLASKYCLSKISAVPSLQGGLLHFKKDVLEIITTNLNDFFNTQLPIQGNEEIIIVVDIKKIVEFLSFLSPGDITLSVEKSTLIIEKDKTVGTFPTISSNDFPKIPIIEGKTHELPAKYLSKNLPFVLFSVSKDENRPILTGVNFLIRDDVQYIVSTDGFRLSLLKAKATNTVSDVIISSHILQDIISFGKDSMLTIGEKEKMISIKCEDYTISTRLIEGEFPPFERVIPDGFKTRITLDHDEFLRNIKLSSVFARDFSSIIVMEVKKEGIYIRPKLKDDKGTVIFQEGEFEGEEEKISFNYRFIQEYLNNVKSKKVIFEMNGANSPGIFRSEENKDYLHIIMPIRTD